MPTRRTITLVASFALSCLCPGTWGGDFPELKGPYLGQPEPGSTPEVFAPGIISTPAPEGASWFSADGRLFLFARARSALDGILLMEQVAGVWSAPRLAPFSAGGHDWDFVLAPDDTTVFVASGRPPAPGAAVPRDHSIWVSNRIAKGWSSAERLPAPVNTGQHDSYPSVATDGTLYFFSRRDGGLGYGDIYVSRPADGVYTRVENLGAPINSPFHEVDPFIAPDQSYLLFCSDRPGGHGKDDMYVVFARGGGGWTAPVNLGEAVNSPHQEYIPSVSRDGRFFFFTSNRTGQRDIYWMEASVIERLRPEESEAPAAP
jgi:Tol biopolymer transport system component